MKEEKTLQEKIVEEGKKIQRQEFLRKWYETLMNGGQYESKRHRVYSKGTH